MKKLSTHEIAARLLSGVPRLQRETLDHLQRVAASRLRQACKVLGVKHADLFDHDKAVAVNLALRAPRLHEVSLAPAPKAGEQAERRIVVDVVNAEFSDNERRAGALLRWCIYAHEQGLNEIAKVRLIVALTGFDVEDAALGQTMRGGRKVGTEGPVRLAIRAVLAGHATPTPAAVWKSLKADPPEGMACYETAHSGKYIETEGHGETKYRQFENLVSQEKKRIRKAGSQELANP